MIFRKFTVMQPTPLLSHNLESFLGKIWNWPPYTESKERPEKGRGHSRLIGGKCTKQGSLQSEFVSGTTRQADLSIYYQNLQSLYRDLNEVQPLSQSRWSHQTHCSPKTMFLKRLSLWEQWAEHPFQGQFWGPWSGLETGPRLEGQLACCSTRLQVCTPVQC